MSLYANGANLGDLRGLTDLFLGSGLRPRLFLLGIHPLLLAKSDHYLSDDTTFDPRPFLKAIADHRVRDAKDEFMSMMAAPLNAAFPSRTRIGHSSRIFVIEAKRRMFARLGMGAESLYAPDQDPWTVHSTVPNPEESLPIVEKKSAEASVRELNEGVMRQGPGGDVRDKGWFDRANYSTDGYNARSLVEIVRAVRGQGIEIMIVLLPESTLYWQTVPAEAMKDLEAVLQDAFGDKAPRIINLRHAIPDRMFSDNLHQNHEGGLATTRLLIEAISRRPMPARPTAGN